MWNLTKENLKLPEVKGKSGIYRFWCNEHSYIGSAKDFKHRLSTHINTMIKGTHHNHTVQNVFNKYGLDLFIFEILEYCSVENLLVRETYYIQTLKPDMNHILDAVRIERDQETIERTRISQKKYYEIHRPVNSKKVYQYTLDGEFIQEFETATDAAKATGREDPNDICSVCTGRAKTARKYRWSYEKVESLPKLIKNVKFKTIYQLDSDNKLIAIWNKLSDIEHQLHIVKSTIKEYLDSGDLYKNCYWTTKVPTDLTVYYTENPILSLPKFGPNLKASVKVYQYDLDGNFIKEYVSAAEADRQMGATSVGAVSNAAREGTNNKTAYGYQWSYKKHDKIEPYINNSAKAKIVNVYIFDIFNNKYLQFESIAETVRNLIGNTNFDSDCATLSSCCKLGAIFKYKYLASYTDKFKLPKRKTVVFNSRDNLFYSNIKEASEKTGISEYKLKQSCIDQSNVEWNYVVDCARIKLSESGKLLEEGQS